MAVCNHLDPCRLASPTSDLHWYATVIKVERVPSSHAELRQPLALALVLLAGELWAASDPLHRRDVPRRVQIADTRKSSAMQRPA